jgi:hypothetical protein
MESRPRGRPRTPSTLSIDAFEQAVRRLGGLRETSRRLRVHISTLRGYRRGERNVSAEVVARLDAALSHQATASAT